MTGSEPPEVLAFAVVGHPNEGKSSVVSTLTERDDIRVSPTPGETDICAVYNVEINDQPMLRFVDTPGFQVPRKTLKWLERRQIGEDTLVTAVAFSKAFSGRSAFSHDERILRAVADTQGLLYIVDAAKPVGPDDLAEMEILRRLGKTRMAVLNSKGDDSAYVEEWRAALNRHFNAVRSFDAMEAAFDERINLLSSLRLTDQSWELDIDRVISAMGSERIRRKKRAADAICSLLRDCLTKQMKAPMRKDDDRSAVQESLMPRYTDWLRQREARTHQDLRAEFRHNQFKLIMQENDLVTQDLFSRETWRVLGLTRRQLTTVSSLAGAATGAVVDVALGEITFGVFMAGGAALGAVSGLVGSRPLSQIRIRTAGMNHRIGKRYLEIGPPKGVQLAFILIDRALLYLDTVSNRAHANRLSADAGEVKSSIPLSRNWTRKDQAAVSRFSTRLSRGKHGDNEESELRETLIRILGA